MKEIVLNRTFGGFRFGKKFCEHYHCSPYGYDFDTSMLDEEMRMDERLVEWVKQYPEDNPSLKVYVIPDDATDWEINEYDGMESLTLVINGKIVHR